jgi:hypothetical protein
MFTLPTGAKKISMVIFSLLVLVLVLAFFVQRNIERRVKLVLDQRIASLAPFVTIHYERVAFNPLLWDLHIHHVQIALPHQDSIAIEEIILENWDRNHEHQLPYVASLRVNNANLPVALLGEQGWFSNWGQKNILLSLMLDVYYEEKQQSLRIKEIAIAIPDAGQLNLTADFGNVPWQEGIASVMAKSYASLLQAMTIHYCDDSLLDRIMQAEAKQAGATPEMIRQSWLGSLTAKEQKAQGNPQRAHFYASLQHFLQKPECLRIAMAPKQPLPLGRLLQVTSEDELYRLVAPEVTLR